jgi:tight adherence protein C
MAAGMAAIASLVALYGLYLRFTRSRLHVRLRTYANVDESVVARNARAMQRASNMRPVVLSLAKLCHNVMPARVLEDLRGRLILAGRPTGWHLSQFLASKVMLAAGLGVGAWLFVAAMELPGSTALAVTGCMGLLGYYLPHPWLGAQIKARQKEIQRKLPDALDLMTVGVGAGLSLDGSILEIVQKSDNALSRELATFLGEMRMGRSRREALQSLDRRTQVDDIKVLVASLIQAEELGMSLGEALTIQADQMRQRRRQRAEELAHKATIKMMFPMILMIFPALFVVIMGPAVPSMLAVFGGG